MPYQPVIKEERKEEIVFLMAQILTDRFEPTQAMYHHGELNEYSRIIVLNEMLNYGDCPELPQWDCQVFAKCFVSALRMAFPLTHGNMIDVVSRERHGNYLKNVRQKQLPFRHILTNRYPYGKKLFIRDEGEDDCHCKVQKDGKRCEDLSCENRAMFSECVRSETHPDCLNQRIQNRSFLISMLETFRIFGKGHGVRSKGTNNSCIVKGAVIGEYVGEVMKMDKYRKRVTTSYAAHQHFFAMQMEADIVVDSTNNGNILRFVNHSCVPNCQIEKWYVGNTRHLILVAITDINPGVEITYSYGWSANGVPFRCFCGEKEKCTGFVGSK